MTTIHAEQLLENILDTTGDVSALGAKRVSFMRTMLNDCESLDQFTALLAAANLQLSTEHRGKGEHSVSFDKVAGGTVAGVQAAFPAQDYGYNTPFANLEYWLYLSDLANVVSVYIALGSSITNHWYWSTPVAELVAGWNYVSVSMLDAFQTGTGCSLGAVTWGANAVVFGAAGDTLAGILLDNVIHSVVEPMRIVERPCQHETVLLTATPTITAGAYAAGDTVGGRMEFPNAARIAGGCGVIEKVVVVDDGNQDAALDLILYDRTFTPTADNAPLAPSDADLQNCEGHVRIVATDYSSFANNSEAVVLPGLRYKLLGTSLFAQMGTPGTPTYTATDDLTVKLLVTRE